MGHSEYDRAAKERHPWNVGRTVGAKRALKPQQVWAPAAQLYIRTFVWLLELAGSCLPASGWRPERSGHRRLER